MSPTIGEAHLLATYSVSNRPPVGNSTRLYVAYSLHNKNSDGEITVAAPGDGIHTLHVRFISQN